MTCPVPQELAAGWTPSEGGVVSEGALVLDPLMTDPVVGHEFSPADEQVVMFAWEIVELGAEPLSLGIWRNDPSDGIFYRTDGFIVIAGEETQTIAAEAGDTVQLYINVQDNEIVFVLNGVAL